MSQNPAETWKSGGVSTVWHRSFNN